MERRQVIDVVVKIVMPEDMSAHALVERMMDQFGDELASIELHSESEERDPTDEERMSLGDYDDRAAEVFCQTCGREKSAPAGRCPQHEAP